MPPEAYQVIKVFNNNVILARHLETEKILIRKGLGFEKKPGDLLNSEMVFEKVFVIENKETSNRFIQLTDQVEASLIGVCEEIIGMISTELNDPLTEEIHVKLIDHIAFTLYRIKKNDKIENPFLFEIETLYAKEMSIAKMAIEMLEKNTGMLIPEGEIGFIALHIHSLKNRGKLSNTIKYTYICNSAIELIEDELNLEIDRRSIDYARFITHIRYGIERILKNIPVKNELLGSIKKTYKDSFKLAKKVAKLIEEEISCSVPDEEIGYLTMHIERLKNISSFNLQLN